MEIRLKLSSTKLKNNEYVLDIEVENLGNILRGPPSNPYIQKKRERLNQCRTIAHSLEEATISLNQPRD
jgi:hypothetical protein